MKRYESGGSAFQLSVPRLDIHAGAKLAFIGESGSGKSTVLELLAMILRPTSSAVFEFAPDNKGRFEIDAVWQSGGQDELADLRRQHIGFVLQNGGLLPYLTVRQNIDLSRSLRYGDAGPESQQWASRLNIAEQLDKLPSALSIGQRQRAAIARALVHNPAVLIADEPTAALDPYNAELTMELMSGLVDELGMTLILASHAHELMRKSGLHPVDHTVEMIDENTMHVTVADASG